MRAKHPKVSIRYLHGSLFEIKCSGLGCDYKEDNFSDPIVPALAVPEAKKSIEQKAPGPTAGEGGDDPTSGVLEYDEEAELPTLRISDLPLCPKCMRFLSYYILGLVTKYMGA